VSARLRARATARADGLDKVRALQRGLYRSAKQQPHRRFHALFDKVARSDVLCRAWGEVPLKPRGARRGWGHHRRGRGVRGSSLPR
jgi:hypothetical protein